MTALGRWSGEDGAAWAQLACTPVAALAGAVAAVLLARPALLAGAFALAAALAAGLPAFPAGPPRRRLSSPSPRGASVR